MWVYWLSLGALTVLLFFPYKKIFSTSIAIRASIATFILGFIYPLLQAALSLWQAGMIIGVLLLLLSVIISKIDSRWNASKNTDTLEPEQMIAEAPEQSVEGQVVWEYALRQELHQERHVNAISTETENSIMLEQSPSVDDALAESPVMAKEPLLEEPVISEEPVAELLPDEPAMPEEPVAELPPEEPVIPEESMVELLPEEPAMQKESVVELLPEEPVMRKEPVVELLPEEPVMQEEPATEPSSLQAFVASGSPRTLLVEGLRLAKQQQYAQAIRRFQKVVADQTEPELLYLAICELSSLYQHLGLYPMASEIIGAFENHPVLRQHPGMANLKQKRKFIQCLITLLNRDRHGHIPYAEVPAAVRREAFDSLNNKHLIS
ncbi:hypothetical protein [Desulforamulus aeronauticus]|uniref:Tetratricopeptide repeat-containing protein n=1 Tax=Desulforamulus aeronauticus DSM 10349 TaxID=1121421 RepID=A0A1M6TMD6_9FIRM|nr:hypothetical protein [Desulforamulus aeronauticus]SHK58104.1 hypothetical protein SAMN02745123_02377 [Desulforamulus aeronauticus DSM 10349]